LADRLAYHDALNLAIDVSRRAWQRHPNDVTANLNLASHLKKAKPPRLEEAARYYTAAIALRPDSACTHNNLAVTLSDLGRDSEAIMEYREALRIQPDFLLAAENINRIFVRQGNRSEGIAELRKFIELNPGNGRVHYVLGTSLMNQGELKDAIKHLREAARVHPNTSPIRINLGYALRKEGRLEEAVQQYREALRILPANMWIRSMLADTLMQQGKQEEALDVLHEPLKMHPDSAVAHNFIAWALATGTNTRSCDPEEAVEHAKEAVKLSPEKPCWWTTLGAAQYRAGNWDAAVDALTTSMKLHGGKHFSHDSFFLAMVQWRLGKKDEAHRWYDKAVEWMEKNKPDDEELTRFRAEAAELLGVAQEPEKADDSQPSDEKEKPTTEGSTEKPNPEIKQNENEF
jgi:tetratricopeptide (TPR) repeat protein